MDAKSVGLFDSNGIACLVNDEFLPSTIRPDNSRQPAVLRCPAETMIDYGFSTPPSTPAYFRTVAGTGAPGILEVTPLGGLCQRCRGNFLNFTSAPLYTHYHLNGTWAHYSDGGANGGQSTFGPGAGLTINQLPGYADMSPSNYENASVTHLRVPQLKLDSLKSPSDSWIVVESGNCDAAPFSTLYRHPNLSVNYAYLDGHAQNLRTLDTDGWNWFGGETSSLNDARADLIR